MKPQDRAAVIKFLTTITTTVNPRTSIFDTADAAASEVELADVYSAWLVVTHALATRAAIDGGVISPDDSNGLSALRVLRALEPRWGLSPEPLRVVVTAFEKAGISMLAETRDREVNDISARATQLIEAAETAAPAVAEELHAAAEALIARAERLVALTDGELLLLGRSLRRGSIDDIDAALADAAANLAAEEQRAAR